MNTRSALNTINKSLDKDAQNAYQTRLKEGQRMKEEYFEQVRERSLDKQKGERLGHSIEVTRGGRTLEISTERQRE